MSDRQRESASARASRSQSQQKYVLFLLILCVLSAWRLRSVELSSLHPREVDIDEAVLFMLKKASNLTSTLEAVVNVLSASEVRPAPVNTRTPKAVVAYATSITHCKPGSTGLIDGAAVLIVLPGYAWARRGGCRRGGTSEEGFGEARRAGPDELVPTRRRPDEEANPTRRATDEEGLCRAGK